MKTRHTGLTFSHTHEPLLALFTSPQSIILSLGLHTELFAHVVKPLQLPAVGEACRSKLIQ